MTIRHCLWTAGLTALSLAGAVLAIGEAKIAPGQQTFAAPGQNSPWQPVLEGLWGDRVAALAYVGADLGDGNYVLSVLPEDKGLYRSLPDGKSFAQKTITQARPREVVETVARAGADPTGNTLYAGLLGRPMFARSEDGGDTWETTVGPTGTSAPSRFNAIVSTRATSSTIYATEMGLPRYWTSGDGGITWTMRTSPGGGFIRDLDAPVDTPEVFMVAGNSLYRSPGPSQGWVQVLGPEVGARLDVRMMATALRGRIYAVGKDDTQHWQVVTSTNGGDSWSGGEGWPGDLADEPAVLGAGDVRLEVPGVWLGLRNGKVFLQATDVQGWQLLDTLPVEPTTMAVSPSGGRAWVGSDGLGLYQVSPVLLHTGAVAVDTLSVISTTADGSGPLYLWALLHSERNEGETLLPPLYALYDSVGGQVWERRHFHSDTGLGTRLMVSPRFDQDHQLYCGQLRSIDGGASWQPFGAAPGGFIPSLLAVGPISGTVPVLYGLLSPFAGDNSGKGVVLSEDGGLSWQLADNNITGIVAGAVDPDFASNRTAYIVTDRGRVYRAEDGLTFIDIGQVPSLTPERSVWDFVLSPNFRRDNLIMMAVDEPSSPQQRAKVYISTNGGQSWSERKSGLYGQSRPRSLIFSPAFATDRVIYLGGERTTLDPAVPTLYSSDGAGADWYPEAVLQGPAQVWQLAWNGDTVSGRLFAAAGDGGLWVRDVLPKPGPLLATVTPAGARSATPTRTPTRTPTLPVGTASTPTPTVVPTLTEAPTASPTLSPTTASPTEVTPTAVTEASTTPTPTSTATLAPATPTASRTPTATRRATATPQAVRVFAPYAVKRAILGRR